jgi:hypothetical protein
MTPYRPAVRKSVDEDNQRFFGGGGGIRVVADVMEFESVL